MPNNNSQTSAPSNYRARLQQKGMARFEVLALDTDRDLIRSLAKRLASNDAESARIRASVEENVSGEPTRGRIYAALRRSPLVGADIDFSRPDVPGRPVDL